MAPEIFGFEDAKPVHRESKKQHIFLSNLCSTMIQKICGRLLYSDTKQNAPNVVVIKIIKYDSHGIVIIALLRNK